MNIKKLFSDKKESKKSIADFFDKKGFYIVLVLCVGILGASVAFLTSYRFEAPKAELDSQKVLTDEKSEGLALNGEENQSVQSSINEVPKISEADSKETKKKDTKKEDKPKIKASEAPKTKNAPKSGKNAIGNDLKLALPVSGEVIFDYANDKLVYSKTLEEWTTHFGVDLASDRGTPVKAAADGVVSDVKTDPKLGITVVIDHQNGIKSVYSNLAGDDMVSPNQKVKQGEVLGCIGSTASFESADQAHLHFEVLKNDNPVDPHKYLPKKADN